MKEEIYKRIIDNYLADKLDITKFIDHFKQQWRRDKAKKVYNDLQFQWSINRIFTSCNLYAVKPECHYEIDENQLREEVGKFRNIWYG